MNFFNGQQEYTVLYLHWPSHKLSSQCPYLIDGKTDGLHVLSHFPHAPPVLLHKAHQEGATLLAIIRVIILLVQLDDKLRVHPEGV